MGNHDALIAAMGERSEFESSPTVPDSYYGVQLAVGDIGLSDNGAPFVQLGGGLYLAAKDLVGVEKSMRVYISPGKLRTDGKPSGGILSLLNGFTRSITGQAADVGALISAGFEPPDRGGKDDKEYGAAVRNAIAEFVAGQEPDQRLALMVKYLRLPLWDRKKVVAHITQEAGQEGTDSEGKVFNRWGGFYPTSDPKHGEAYVRNVAIPKQQEYLDALGA